MPSTSHVYARIGALWRAIGRGANLMIAGCSIVHAVVEAQHDLVRVPAPACGAVPARFGLRRVRAVLEPVSCRRCLRMVRAGETVVRVPSQRTSQPVIPGL